MFEITRMLECVGDAKTAGTGSLGEATETGGLTGLGLGLLAREKRDLSSP